MNGRAQWCDYIQRHPDVLRLFSARGDVKLVEGVLGDDTRIGEFISKLSDPRKDPRLLYGLMYLLRPELRDFILGPVTRLVKTAARSTKKTMMVSRTGVRGPVLWHRTLVGRITGQLHPGSFELRLSERHQDVAENQLLKLFLQNIVRTSLTLIREVSSGMASKQLLVIRERAGKLLRANWLQDVTSRRSVTALMSRRATRSKDARYAQILKFQSEYQAVFDRPRWQFILALIHKAWLEPVSSDDVFELYTLLRVIDVLRSQLDFESPYRLGLIARNRREVAMMRRTSDLARVYMYFDQSPASVFGVVSSYTQLLDEYENIAAQPRRPDLMIRFVRANREKMLLLECKDSADDGYRRDSVYKAMGYLKDFSELWSGNETQRPKIVVVFPTDVKRKQIPESDIKLVGATDVSELAASLRSAFLA